MFIAAAQTDRHVRRLTDNRIETNSPG